MRVTQRQGTIEAECALQATADPKQIVIKPVHGPAREKIPGIYQISGDQMTVCFNLHANQPATNEPGTQPGDGRLLVRLER